MVQDPICKNSLMTFWKNFQRVFWKFAEGTAAWISAGYFGWISETAVEPFLEELFLRISRKSSLAISIATLRRFLPGTSKRIPRWPFGIMHGGTSEGLSSETPERISGRIFERISGLAFGQIPWDTSRRIPAIILKETYKKKYGRILEDAPGSAQKGISI